MVCSYIHSSFYYIHWHIRLFSLPNEQVATAKCRHSHRLLAVPLLSYLRSQSLAHLSLLKAWGLPFVLVHTYQESQNDLFPVVNELPQNFQHNPTTLLQLCPYVQHHLQYAEPQFGTHTNRDMPTVNSLIKVQTFALKVSTRSWAMDYGSLLNSCKFP